MSSALPVVVIMSRTCKVELLSCPEPTFKPTFMTGVSDAAEFFMAFINFDCGTPQHVHTPPWYFVKS